MNKKIIVICGPTGIGKTGFAIRLAGRFQGEIVGADSMQIYRHMDIGTAKPDMDELAMARHHLIDVADPVEEFDAARFVRLADQAIHEIIKNSRLPIVAGGTGFYIKALLHGLFRSKPANINTIKILERELKETSSDHLHNRLKEMDPESALRIHPNDAFRIIRALEVLQTTGKKISTLQNSHQFSQQRYQSLTIGLYMDRETLYQRIEKRVDQMMDLGLIDEVKKLNAMGYPCSLKAMQSIGYRHVCDHLYQGVSLEETLRLLKRDTRRYAKRQLTWFRKMGDIIWLKPDETARAESLIHDFLGEH